MRYRVPSFGNNAATAHVFRRAKKKPDQSRRYVNMHRDRHGERASERAPNQQVISRQHAIFPARRFSNDRHAHVRILRGRACVCARA